MGTGSWGGKSPDLLQVDQLASINKTMAHIETQLKAIANILNQMLTEMRSRR